MPFYHPPILHDRQSTSSQLEQSTSSLEFVDIVGATLTAKDIGDCGNYDILFTVLISATSNNTKAMFRFTVNGVSPTPAGTPVFLKVKDFDLSYTFPVNATDIKIGDVLQAQWATDKGTITMTEFNILIDGIPQSRIIE